MLRNLNVKTGNMSELRERELLQAPGAPRKGIIIFRPKTADQRLSGQRQAVDCAMRRGQGRLSGQQLAPNTLTREEIGRHLFPAVSHVDCESGACSVIYLAVCSYQIVDGCRILVGVIVQESASFKQFASFHGDSFLKGVCCGRQH